MTTKRLIEDYLPIAALSEESTRERRRPTSLPPINFLHVWWARRPLIASRAAVLASLLPADADRDDFLHALGIHGDPVATKKQIDSANRRGVDLGSDPYGYPRAFTFSPAKEVTSAFGDITDAVVLDPTAGGGSIPFEGMRLGFKTIANDLNPVAALILKATLQFPSSYGSDLLSEFERLADLFIKSTTQRLEGVYPTESLDTRIDGYLWARTIKCPYCDGVVPLAPNWRLSPSGTGLQIQPVTEGVTEGQSRHCKTIIVDSPQDHSAGTVAGGDAVCPFADCGRSIAGEVIKAQAQAGEMRDQLIAVAAKVKTPVGATKTGKARYKWVREFRSPTPHDVNEHAIQAMLDKKLPEWDALNYIPNEDVPSGSKTDEARRYGMDAWRKMFSPRQLLVHGTSVEVFRDLLERETNLGPISDISRAAYIYLAFSLDKLLNYNSRMSIWMPTREVIANTFNRHDFAFCWSYAEMAHAVTGGGLAWSIDQVRDSLKKIIQLVENAGNTQKLALGDHADLAIPTVIRGSGAELFDVASQSVDAVVMDPPYGANVMYAELSDFFYVWLKRTAGLVFPDLFTQRLADKNSEAVANKAHFTGQKGSAKLAERDYREKMATIFTECRRVLKTDGIMTVMFTHKETGAWDALAMSLMDAGFVITASWPVNTEAESSLHIKDKAAANSTIFLVCRPRNDAHCDTMYWEDVEPEVARAVRARVGEFQQAGIQGVDLYLASFGPALEAFSRHWPLTRGTPAPEPKKKRRTQGEMFEEFDPYAVRPEDALNAARREVKAWRLAQLASAKAQADMDGPTAFYVLAWDAFKAVSFPYDEALRLARAVGVDLEAQVIGRLAEKKAAEIKLWDSATRVAKGAIGPADGSRGMIDALHHAAHVMRTRGAEAAQEMLEQAGVAKEDEFKVAMEALLEVLPPSKTFSGIDADKAVKPAADDFDALEKLRRIAYEGEIGEPQQLELYRELMAAE